ncbi:MAG: UDP-3-O-acyl-N-acetylglucosamine deacetylase [Desulfatitalea sp.]|nr:UDP-3-O-acyl-N-acetylglucosamine deacetylase [Desulfatitalea sp.]NNJ98789.1 UDP-3-O-acyl-N-acetylglucosamine deacetylase [Desulfatitalea sp.]
MTHVDQRQHWQQTLATEATCSGIALHSGERVSLRIKPAPINHGIKFVRIDLPNRPTVSAKFNKVVDTSQATVLGEQGLIISTIEHLMAAFAGLSIDNALVEVDGYELPAMDGSAGPFVRMLRSAGTQEQPAPRIYFVVQKPVELQDKDRFVGIYPAPRFRITFTIKYQRCPLIKTQSYDLDVTPDHFADEIAEARTFGFVEEVEYMKMYGLAKGASLDNAVVIDRNVVLNNSGLRYPNEFVRHKVLDCIGDFSLIGLPIIGHVVAKRSGHAFNHAFLEKFFEHKVAWRTQTLDELYESQVATLKQLAN